MRLNLCTMHGCSVSTGLEFEHERNVSRGLGTYSRMTFRFALFVSAYQAACTPGFDMRCCEKLFRNVV